MTYTPPVRFDAPYPEVDLCFIDFETTGLPPQGRACEVGFSRFERGVCVASYGSLVKPGHPIPAEATAIHGITDEMVKDAPSLEDVFEEPRVRALLAGAQPGAYSASFDRNFTPRNGLVDTAWPWVDTLVLVRKVDRFERGKGRHKLTAACERHDVVLAKAHSAEDDARAAGELFYKLMPKAHVNHDRWSIGELLHWMRQEENNEWRRFHEYRARHPQQQP